MIIKMITLSPIIGLLKWKTKKIKMIIIFENKIAGNNIVDETYNQNNKEKENNYKGQCKKNEYDDNNDDNTSCKYNVDKIDTENKRNNGKDEVCTVSTKKNIQKKTNVTKIIPSVIVLQFRQSC